MKYVNEFRNAQLAQQLAKEITSIATQPWIIMEICGGQTHAIVKYGIDQLLPSNITLVHGTDAFLRGSLCSLLSLSPARSSCLIPNSSISPVLL
jgi:hypothetical protein